MRKAFAGENGQTKPLVLPQILPSTALTSCHEEMSHAPGSAATYDSNPQPSRRTPFSMHCRLPLTLAVGGPLAMLATGLMAPNACLSDVSDYSFEKFFIFGGCHMLQVASELCVGRAGIAPKDMSDATGWTVVLTAAVGLPSCCDAAGSCSHGRRGASEAVAAVAERVSHRQAFPLSPLRLCNLLRIASSPRVRIGRGLSCAGASSTTTRQPSGR
jgi:hypothetical protein